MTTQPKYFTADTYDYARFAEWIAFSKLVHSSQREVRNAYPDLVSKATFVWQEQYHKFVKMEEHPKWGGKAKRLNKLMRELGEGKVETIEIFQDRLADEVLRTKGAATSKQEQYTQARTEAMKAKAATDGTAFINNNKLLSKAHIAGAALAHTNWDKDTLQATASQLEQDYSEEPLMAEEFNLLVLRLKDKATRMEKQMKPQEAELLRNPKDKNSQKAYIIYGFFKLHLEVGETKAMSDSVIRKETPFGPTAFYKAVKLLEDLGLIELTEEGKRGSLIRQANIYKRLV